MHWQGHVWNKPIYSKEPLCTSISDYWCTLWLWAKICNCGWKQSTMAGQTQETIIILYSKSMGYAFCEFITGSIHISMLWFTMRDIQPVVLSRATQLSTSSHWKLVLYSIRFFINYCVSFPRVLIFWACLWLWYFFS